MSFRICVFPNIESAAPFHKEDLRICGSFSKVKRTLTKSKLISFGYVGSVLLQALLTPTSLSALSLISSRKPDPKIYQYALDQLGVKGEEAVFLDDIGM